VATLPDHLTGRDVELTKWSPEIVDELLGAISVSLPELHRWMPWASALPTRDELAETLRAGSETFDSDGDYQYYLRERLSGEVVGCAGLHRRVGDEGLEIGYWVRSDRVNLGYATETARLLTSAAFRFVPNVQRVEIHMDQANGASAAIPPKLGFRLVQIEPRPVGAPGESGRELVWSMSRPDWPPESEL
jgi:RimJ/RimL family protein N-acetyltransferase